MRGQCEGYRSITTVWKEAAYRHSQSTSIRVSVFCMARRVDHS